MDQSMMQGSHCKCAHHKFTPFLIVLIGLTFILKAQGYVAADAAGLIWGVLIMLIGFQKLSRGKCKCAMNHKC